MSPLQRANFFTSAATPAQFPASRGEVAFAGRSNSGKSSALNALAQKRRLAFVSKTPGRTQLINFYALGEDHYLVDLPGYGYARVPEAMRASWKDFLGDYVRARAALRGLVLIMDARHPLTGLDRALLAWFRPTGKPVHVLLSKADKLSRAAALAVLREVRRELAAMARNFSAQLFSSLGKTGVEDARTVIEKWFGPDTGPAAQAHKQKPRAEVIRPGAKTP